MRSILFLGEADPHEPFRGSTKGLRPFVRLRTVGRLSSAPYYVGSLLEAPSLWGSLRDPFVPSGRGGAKAPPSTRRDVTYSPEGALKQSFRAFKQAKPAPNGTAGVLRLRPQTRARACRRSVRGLAKPSVLGFAQCQAKLDRLIIFK